MPVEWNVLAPAGDAQRLIAGDRPDPGLGWAGAAAGAPPGTERRLLSGIVSAFGVEIAACLTQGEQTKSCPVPAANLAITGSRAPPN